MKTLRLLVLIFVGQSIQLGGLHAQTPPSRPAGWPSADTVVEFILSGRPVGGTATAEIVQCPHETPYGDSLIALLTTRHLTEAQASRVRGPWLQVARKCAEPRVVEWLRRDFAHNPTPEVARELIHVPSGAIREALEQVAMDTTLHEHVRSSILHVISRSRHPVERVDLYFRVLANSRIPSTYDYFELEYLMRSPAREAFVRGMLATTRSIPDHPDIPALFEATARKSCGDRQLQSLLRAEAVRLAHPASVAPPKLRAAADNALRAFAPP